MKDGAVHIKNLVKTYLDEHGNPSFTAVKNINLEIQDGEFVVLVGPSGCGKSTTLRMLAGLENITSGTIAIGDRVVNNVHPKDRGIAMVFQNYALYPHMSIFDNIAFGLKLAKKPKDVIQKKVTETARSLGLDKMLDRKPGALSGGQRQRVALGRAIVRDPKVFLFDEPLSNLDAKMRVHMRSEISRLHTQLTTTMVYVTHDQVEAMTMGDRICVMRDGNIMQVADPLTLYRQPENIFVAGFIGSPPMNLLKGKVQKLDGGAELCRGCPAECHDRPPARQARESGWPLRGQAHYFRHPSRASQRPGQRSYPRPGERGHRHLGADGLGINRLSEGRNRQSHRPCARGTSLPSW